MLYIHAPKSSDWIAKQLSLSLKAKLLLLHSFPILSSDIIINWGSTKSSPHVQKNTFWLNHPRDVAMINNKIKMFKLLQTNLLPTVPTTTSKKIAQTWSKDNKIVFARIGSVTRYSRNFRLNYPKEHWTNAPLYTKNIESMIEYRIHIFEQELVGIERKTTSTTILYPSSSTVKIPECGWRLTCENIKPSKKLITIARNISKVIPLNFMAIDFVGMGCIDGNITPFILNITPNPIINNQIFANWIKIFRFYKDIAR